MRHRATYVLLLALALGIGAGPAVYAAAEPVLVFSPPAGKFGMINRGDKVELKVTVTNRGARAAELKLVPTCTCMTVEPESAVIPAGGAGTFTLRYDSSDDTGITRKDFLVVTDPPGLANPYYSLLGTVRAERPPASSGTWTRPGAAGEEARLSVFYYYTPGCRTCEEFLAVEIPRLEKDLGVKIALEKRDLTQPQALEELSRAASSVGDTVRAVPVLRAGSALLQGDTEIRARVPDVLRVQIRARGAGVPAAAAPAGTGLPGTGIVGLGGALGDRLAVLPVIAAGLVDGVNPCAFTTLIFLLASLALAGRGRREVLVIGALFSLAVFLTYLGIGYGLFTALRAATAVNVISVVLRWVLVAVLAVFAIISLYDYALIRRGRPTEILLQLPPVLKKQIHNSIRTRVRTAAIAGSSLALGFLVSVFEFACTGQVYLPLLTVMARMRRGPEALALLVLYNFCFIIPLLVVFAANYLGVSSQRITALFQRHMGATKVVLAAVFACLAVVTLVG
ncbi:MAG TPA: DUF1573 domain-containing protein [Spirochaetia bacterium]|nr:DUF1573 domain-containing protein [Spirochaetia bacterium]